MKLIIMKNEDYLELTSELTGLIVYERFGDDAIIEDDGEDCTKYTEEAQDYFNDRLMDVEYKLRISRIYSEDDEVVIAKRKREKEEDLLAVQILASDIDIEDIPN